jgi:glycosyltransferase involved in cell wall biosynthesis
MAAWSSFTERGRVPNCYLLMHTAPSPKDGVDLRTIARHLGLVPAGCTCGTRPCPLPLTEHKVIFGAHEQQKPADLVSWYQALDVYLGATYGEGFGVPVIEALACGVPVIGSKNTAITEKIGKGCGWLVNCQPFWHWDHEAEWRIPRISEIAAALGHAMGKASAPPGAVDRYDADYVTLNHFKGVLDELGAVQ